MSAGSLTIVLRPSHRQVEADGSRCSVCDDQIFLHQFDLVLRNDHNSIFATAPLCQSCAECLGHGLQVEG